MFLRIFRTKIIVVGKCKIEIPNNSSNLEGVELMCRLIQKSKSSRSGATWLAIGQKM
jgi:hypothetical protein